MDTNINKHSAVAISVQTNHVFIFPQLSSAHYKQEMDIATQQHIHIINKAGLLELA